MELARPGGVRPQPERLRVEYDGHFDFGDPANGHIYDDVLWENQNGVTIPNVHPPNSADHVYRYRPC
jgi:hypothetical protein